MLQETRSQGDGHRYWYRVDNRVHGPISGPELTLLVRNGVLKDDAYVWLDGSKEIFLVTQIAGIFGINNTNSKAGEHRNSQVDQSKQDENCDHLVNEQIPIIRLVRGIFRSQLVVVYSDHMLYKTRFFGSFKLTESDYRQNGEGELIRRLGPFRQIQFASIEKVLAWSTLQGFRGLTCYSKDDKADFVLPLDDSRSILQVLTTKTNAQCLRQNTKSLDIVACLLSIPKVFCTFLFFIIFLVTAEDFSLRAGDVLLNFLSLIWPAIAFRLSAFGRSVRWSKLDCCIAVLAIAYPMAVYTFLLYAIPPDESWNIALAILLGIPIEFPSIWFFYRVFFTARSLTFTDKLEFQRNCMAFKRTIWNSPLVDVIGTGLQKLFDRKNKRRASLPSRRPFLAFALKASGVIYFIGLHRFSDGLILKLDEWTGGSMPFQMWGYVWFVLSAPAAALLYFGYRFSLTPFDQKKSNDARRQVLYLRPFEEDASSSLQPNGWLAALCGIDRMPFASSQQLTVRRTLVDLLTAAHPLRLIRLLFSRSVDTTEESLALFFRTYGPVKAIGRPNEFAPVPGAVRKYVGDDWQDHVLQMIRQSQMIIVQPGFSAGVSWELEQLKKHTDPYRILLCLVLYFQRPDAYERLRNNIKRIWGIALPRNVPYAAAPCFLTFDAEWNPSLHTVSYRNPLVWPFLGDAVDLRYTLEPFIQGAHGGPAESPRHPKWVGTTSMIPVALTAGIVALVISGAIAVLIRVLSGTLVPTV